MVRMKHVPLEDSATDAAATPATPATIDAVGKRRRRKRGRTSSERGRAFRQRQAQDTERLESDVARLRTAISELQVLQSVWEAKYLRSRHTLHGSLVAVACEYHTVFRHGMQLESWLQQEAFVHCVMDPNVGFGSATSSGPAAILEQWRLHSSAFGRYDGGIVGAPHIVGGSDACPVIHVLSEVHALITENTLCGLFPPAARAAARQLLAPYMHTTVTFTCRSAFQFTRENKIGLYLVQLDYAGGFLGAGLTLQEVAELLTLSALTPLSTIALAPDTDA